MKKIICEQGSSEWLAARSGAITASAFAIAVSMTGGLTEQQSIYVHAIRAGQSEDVAALAAGYKTKVKRTETVQRAIDGLPIGEPSESAKRYASDVAIERIWKQPYGEPPKTWVLERGHIMEAQARIAYEARTGRMAMESGIFKTDDDWFGYSTDGEVEDDGLIEIKSPVDTQKILSILQTGDLSEYMHQMQGGMWITGRQWCDFIMYVPALVSVGNDLYIKRVFRDEAFIEQLEADLIRVRSMVLGYESQLRRHYSPTPCELLAA